MFVLASLLLPTGVLPQLAMVTTTTLYFFICLLSRDHIISSQEASVPVFSPFPDSRHRSLQIYHPIQTLVLAASQSHHDLSLPKFFALLLALSLFPLPPAFPNPLFPKLVQSTCVDHRSRGRRAVPTSCLLYRHRYTLFGRPTQGDYQRNRRI